MKQFTLALLLLIFATSISFVHAQRGPNAALRQEIASLKIAHITTSADLTPEESAKFWPLYNKFWDDRRVIMKAKHQIYHQVEQGDLTSGTYSAKLQEIIKLDRAEAKLAEKCITDYGTILGPEKALKVILAEHSFKRVVLNKTRDKNK